MVGERIVVMALRVSQCLHSKYCAAHVAFQARLDDGAGSTARSCTTATTISAGRPATVDRNAAQWLFGIIMDAHMYHGIPLVAARLFPIRVEISHMHHHRFGLWWRRWRTCSIG